MLSWESELDSLSVLVDDARKLYSSLYSLFLRLKRGRENVFIKKDHMWASIIARAYVDCEHVFDMCASRVGWCR